MEATLKKRSVSKYSMVFSTEFTGDSSTEAVVPDVLPDISDILFTTGMVLLRSKTTEDGKVSLSASVSASVVYSPENETGLNCLHLTMPFDAEAESADISADCRTTAEIKLVSIEARMINTRKVSVRAEVSININCYAPDTFALVEDIEAPPEVSLHIKKEELEFSLISDVRERTFVISDEYILPAGSREIREILSPASVVRVDDIKVLGNKLVVRGVCQSHLLCACEDGAEAEQISFSTNFSQMMEMEDIGEDPDISYRLMMTAAYYEPVKTSEQKCTVSMELHMVIQAVCSRAERAELVSDMYSNKCECSFESHSDDLPIIVRRQTLRSTIIETVRTPVPAIETVYAEARVTSVSGRTVGIAVNGLYIDEDGRYRALKGNFTAEFETELEADMELMADMVCVTEAFASPSAEGVEIRVPVELEAVIMKRQTAAVPTQTMLSEKECCAEAPSLILIPVSESADLWQVAKRYGSTRELIEQANCLEGENADISMLLVPREP